MRRTKNELYYKILLLISTYVVDLLTIKSKDASDIIIKALYLRMNSALSFVMISVFANVFLMDSAVAILSKSFLARKFHQLSFIYHDRILHKLSAGFLENHKNLSDMFSLQLLFGTT